jgi:hypothetical protein
MTAHIWKDEILSVFVSCGFPSVDIPSGIFAGHFFRAASLRDWQRNGTVK